MKTCAKHIIGIVLLMVAALSLMAYRNRWAGVRMPAAQERLPVEDTSKAEPTGPALIQMPAQQTGEFPLTSLESTEEPVPQPEEPMIIPGETTPLAGEPKDDTTLTDITAENREETVGEEPYIFGTALAQSDPVEDSYFDTAVFLGDSRTEGLQLFGGLKRGEYLWYRGAVTYIADNPQYAVFRTENGQATMLGALAQKEYSAVYIMTGVNELGNSLRNFWVTLENFLDSVLTLQPRAVIYLQTIPPIHDEKARASGQKEYITNKGIETFNAVIAQVAAEKQVVLLDTAEVYRGENGQLPEELTADGCHFKAKYYARWADYLRNHVMEPERYHMSRRQEPAT